MGKDLPGASSRGGRTSAAGSAAQKTIRVLEASIGSKGWRKLGDIAAEAGVPKPSSHRVLTTLVDEGFLVAGPAGWYAVGPRLRALAAHVRSATADGPLEILQRLQQRVGQTVHLAVLSGDEATYVEKVDADQPYRMASRVGMRIPLHCTAIGKCLLSSLPGEEARTIVRRVGLRRRTSATITTMRGLEAELKMVRTNGYAVDDEENETTIRCVAVPVAAEDGTVVAAVSLSTVTFLVAREEIESYLPPLREAAALLGPAMGH